MSEVFKPVSLYCDVGKTQATVYIPAGKELRDNTDSCVVTPCAGCKQWSEAKIKRVETEIREETMDNFGTDSDSYTGIRDGRTNQLNQLLVDQSRFRGGEPKIIVGMCTPIE